MKESQLKKLFSNTLEEAWTSDETNNFNWIKSLFEKAGIYFPFNTLEEVESNLSPKEISNCTSGDLIVFKSGNQIVIGWIHETTEKLVHFFDEKSGAVGHWELSTSNSNFEIKNIYAAPTTGWLFNFLRKEHQKEGMFAYNSFDYTVEENTVKLSFNFSSPLLGSYEPKIDLSFPPHIDVEGKIKKHNTFFKHILFSIGMVESISYWKASCSSEFEVKAGSLTSQQIQWWEELFYHGLGEFRYLNDIDIKESDFIKISSPIKSSTLPELTQEDCSIEIDEQSILVPVGGGKDSLTSLHLTTKLNKQRNFLLINPTKAAIESVQLYAKDYTNSTVLIKRRIDANLLRQNAEGFLNGHTPFSAALAMYAYLTSFFIGTSEIVLSNESSANEPTIIGTDINHQYSKSFKFEQDINRYFTDYLSNEIRYFSLLRPLIETQIIHLFAKNKEHLSIFKSCNVGSKKDEWCCNCSKCLFVFILLSSEIGIKETTNTFGANLFQNEGLLQTLKELVGLADNKPFECIGTIDETREALSKTIQNESNIESFSLLNWYRSNSGLTLDNPLEELEIGTEHLLPKLYENILKDELGQS